MSDPPKKREAILLDLKDVIMKPIKWLWPDRFRGDGINIISGNQDVGKSTLSLYIAAKVLAGGKWPYLPDFDIETGSVIFLSTEDTINQIIKPKMAALAQELTPLPGNRMVTITGIKETAADGKESGKWLDNLTKDIDILVDAINKIGNVVLIIIDPITDFAGSKKENANADIRDYLGQLRKLAENKKLAIIGLSHLNKDAQKAAAHRTLGSVAWTTLPRAAWIVEYDPNDRMRRCLLLQKCNGARKPLNAAFKLRNVQVTIEGREYGYPVCDFEAKPISITADEILNMDSRRRKQTRIEVAMEWLEDFLSEKPRLSKEIFTARANDKKADISSVTLKRAMTRMRADDVIDVTDIRNEQGHILETKWALSS